jgi:putative polymerase
MTTTTTSAAAFAPSRWQNDRGAASRPAVMALVLAPVGFNFALCFVNTHALSVSNLHVMASEGLIVGLVLLMARRAIGLTGMILLACTILWVTALMALRIVLGTDSSFDIKIARDLAIPFAFFFLGMHSGDRTLGDRIVLAAALAVLAVGLFEYFWLETFTQVFNVAKYYIARGTMEARDALYSGNLFISGVRPAGAEGGRNILSFLGDHRVSSVFLEPVSMGNFGVIVFMWGLVRWMAERGLHWTTMALGMTLIVLSDSRFGALLCIIALVLTLLPMRLATIGTFAMPFAAVALLVLVPALVTASYDPQNRSVDNGFVGRFVLSAQILGEFDALNWFGLQAQKVQAFDSGYAYVIGAIGLAGLLLLWTLIFAIRSASESFFAFRNVAALYYAAILCVSNSPFTIKTAGLLWFLLGALAGSRERERSGVPSLRFRGLTPGRP